ncbi:MAG: cytochrome c oxidase subunit II [Deltaproteobacteria bacterium]|nr:cytochrome c oxidase subunit II [Deltaproteobacteria bacterium]
MENQTEPSLQLPAQLSTFAPEVDWLYHFIFWVSVVFFVGIVGSTLYFMVKYRRRPGVKSEPTGHHNTLELFWTFSPLIILFMMFFWGWQGFLQMAEAPDDAMIVRVRARQWAWTFEHPNGAIEDNEVHVPVDRPVRLVMSSADVLHSFYVPDFRVKRDLVPGMFTSLWFQAVQRDPGSVPDDAEVDPNRVLYTSQVYCAEYCGAGGAWGPNMGHATMYALVHVQRDQDYQAFLRAPRPLPCPQENGTCAVSETECSPEAAGSCLFGSKGCTACHQNQAGGPQLAGPTFVGLWGTQQQLTSGESVEVNEDFVRQSIMDPRSQVAQGYSPVMPQIQLTEPETNALIAYVRSLGTATE